MNAEVTVLYGRLTRCDKSKMTIGGSRLHLPVVNSKKIQATWPIRKELIPVSIA